MKFKAQLRDEIETISGLCQYIEAGHQLGNRGGDIGEVVTH
jgi:hypothetical protein